MDATEIKDPLEDALWVPETIKPSIELDENQQDAEALFLSKTEYEKLLIHVQQELVKRGIYVTDLNELSVTGLINILEKLLEGKSLNNRLKEIIKCDWDYDGPLDHDAIDADSIDFHRFAVEAIDAIRTDKLMHEIIKLMQHAAAKGKIADLSQDPVVEEEILAENEFATAEESPKTFYHHAHVLEEKRKEDQELSDQPNPHKHHGGHEE